MFALKLLLAIATIGLAQPVQAAPAPIVFDFEDGLQGWRLGGTVQRVQTQVLGGEWAIFADGRRFERLTFTALLMEADLTGIASISVEQFFLDGDNNGLGLLVETDPSDLFLLFDIVEPGNPSLRTVDVSSVGENSRLSILWTGNGSTPSPTGLVAFIDNITFHPVPEPSSLALLACGLAALMIYHRRTV